MARRIAARSPLTEAGNALDECRDTQVLHSEQIESDQRCEASTCQIVKHDEFGHAEQGNEQSARCPRGERAPRVGITARAAYGKCAGTRPFRSMLGSTALRWAIRARIDASPAAMDRDRAPLREPAASLDPHSLPFVATWSHPDTSPKQRTAQLIEATKDPPEDTRWIRE